MTKAITLANVRRALLDRATKIDARFGHCIDTTAFLAGNDVYMPLCRAAGYITLLHSEALDTRYGAGVWAVIGDINTRDAAGLVDKTGKEMAALVRELAARLRACELADEFRPACRKWLLSAGLEAAAIELEYIHPSSENFVRNRM